MTLPVANLVKDALAVIYSVYSEDKTVNGLTDGVQALNEMGRALNSVYPVIEIGIAVDATDAGVSEWITAEATLDVGVVLRMTTATNDLTDNALATAKGSAVAIGDIYILDGADSVEYLGNNAGFAFDFDGMTQADFVGFTQ